MKKIFQFFFVIVVVATLLTGLFLGPDFGINVGWNTGISAVPSQGQQVTFCNSCALRPPYDMPYVGWNTGT